MEGISERFLVPALQGSIEASPLIVQGYHADNGSEYVNHRVVALLLQAPAPARSRTTVAEESMPAPFAARGRSGLERRVVSAAGFEQRRDLCHGLLVRPLVAP